MKITIKNVKDAGDINNERVVLHVTAATNIGYYLLGETEIQEDGTVLASLDRVFWFPDKTVAVGDYVILFTKAGEPRQGPNKAKTTNHYFYWDKQVPIWTKADRAPVLFESPEWMAKPIQRSPAK